MQDFIRCLLSLTVGGSLLAAGLLLLGRVKKLPRSFLYYAWVLVLLRLALPLPGNLTLSVPKPVEPLVISDPNPVWLENHEWNQELLDAVETYPVRPRQDLEETPDPITPVYMRPTHMNPWTALTVVWSLGFGVCLVRDLGGYGRFRRAVKRSLKPALSSDLELYTPLAGRRGPELHRCSGLDTPMLMGIARPVLLLPDRNYHPETLTCIFRHELTHYRRGDIWLKWFAMAVLGAHWFNPLTIVIRRAFNQSCELSCDEQILKTMDHDQRKCYGETLLELAARTAPSRTALSTSFSTEKRNLKERLVHIMNFGPKSKWILAITAVLLVGVIIACLALGPAREETPEMSTEEPPASQTTGETQGYDGYMGLSFRDEPRVYTGSPLHVTCRLSASHDTWGDGIGLLLLLDGRPQPYRTGDSDALRYMHTFQPLMGGGPDVELTFDPVAGHEGQTLDLVAVAVKNPDRHTSDPTVPFDHTGGALAALCQVEFEAEPGETTVPGGNRLGCEAEITMEDTPGNGYSFRFTPGARQEGKQKFQAQLTGPAGAEMWVAVYFNNQPVSCLPFTGMENQRTVVDMVMDLRDFQGDGMVYAVFYGRNPNNPSYNFIEVSETYYISVTGAEKAIPGADVQTNVVEASNVDEFLAAIGPDAHIAMKPGTYDLSTAKTYGQPDVSKYYRWEECADGYGLSICNVDNFFIDGDVENCELVTRPRYAPVMHFVNCTRISVRGLTAGHTEGPSGCMGAVMMMTGGSDFEIRSCDLYGCGTYGVEADNCQRITVADSTLRDCSLGAATFSFCQDVSIQETAVYGIGLPPEQASNDAETRRAYEAYSLFSFTGSQMCGIINCDISDSNVRTLLTTNSSQQVYFLGNPVSGLNVSRTVFPSSGSAPVVEGCSFDFENKPEWMYPAYGGIDYVFSVQGEKLYDRDLAAMKHQASPYSLQSVLRVAPEETAPVSQITLTTYPRDTKVVEAATVDEFLAAIAPDTTVVLPEGTFDLKSAADYGKDGRKYYEWVNNGTDGFGLKLHDLKNFHIFGAGKGKTNLESVPRYSDVLYFEACETISVCGITAGHTRQKVTCSGGVLGFTDCKDILVADCGLYGCGILGVDARKCQNLEIRDTEIYECSQGAVRLLECRDVEMKNLNIHDCPAPYFKVNEKSQNVKLDGKKL